MFCISCSSRNYSRGSKPKPLTINLKQQPPFEKRSCVAHLIAHTKKYQQRFCYKLKILCNILMGRGLVKLVPPRFGDNSRVSFFSFSTACPSRIEWFKTEGGSPSTQHSLNTNQVGRSAMLLYEIESF